MRTTIVLDQDVLDRARTVAAKLRAPFRSVVNEALRIGLAEVEQPARQRRYRTKPRPMGVRQGYDLDNIQELLAQSEGEDYR
jgi:hypothetical protein